MVHSPLGASPLVAVGDGHGVAGVVGADAHADECDRGTAVAHGERDGLAGGRRRQVAVLGRRGVRDTVGRESQLCSSVFGVAEARFYKKKPMIAACDGHTHPSGVGMAVPRGWGGETPALDIM